MLKNKLREQDGKRQHKPTNVGGKTVLNFIPLTDYYGSLTL
jgi:hypothetical protein